MGRKHYSAEHIIRLLRQAEIHSSPGRSVPEICREPGVTSTTYYRWRKEYGGTPFSKCNKQLYRLCLIDICESPFLVILRQRE